jgi:hypothetical protein
MAARSAAARARTCFSAWESIRMSSLISGGEDGNNVALLSGFYFILILEKVFTSIYIEKRLFIFKYLFFL